MFALSVRTQLRTYCEGRVALRAEFPAASGSSDVRVCAASVPLSAVSLMYQTGLDEAAHGKCSRLADGAHAGLASSHREDDEGSRLPARFAG